MATPTKFSDLDMVKINNAIAKQHQEVGKVEKFKSDDEARAIVTTALQTTGEQLIRILKPDYIKRGASAKRWACCRDGMLVSEYVDAVVAAGGTRGDAIRDIRYNEKHGLIKVYG